MMQFRPTLIIGLGGSGTFVARRLKKRLFRLVENDIPPSIQILAFDTDRQSPHPLLDELSNLEFHWISDFQGDNFVSRAALSNQPALRDWWKYGRLAPGFVRDGAKQKPPVGRLAFFVKFAVIEKQIRDGVQRMFQRTPTYIPPANVNSVDVYVIGSSCGGTGAGMFFDIAILARDLINNAVREAVLQAHVFLPSCFESTAADVHSLQTNSFAFFKTVEAMQSDSLPPVRYPSRTINSAAKSLFSRVHLLGSVNTAGIKLEDSQDIFETAALQLDLEISGASGRNMKSAIDNAPANFDVRPQGRLAVYSSYGSTCLTGTPDFGRLAVLPDFVRSILTALTAPSEQSLGAGALAITNSAFVHLTAVLSDDVAALDLLTGYETLVMRIRNTEEPERVASQLTASIDSVLAGLSSSGLDSLPSLNSEVREAVCRTIEAGNAGIPRAVDFLERANRDLSAAIDAARLAEAAQIESVNSIAGKLAQFFRSKESKKTELISKGLPYLRDQTLAMVRKSFSLKTKAILSAAAGEVQAYLEALRRFGVSASALLASVEKESKEKIAMKRNVLGAQSMAVDIEEVKNSFAKKTTNLAVGFFGSNASGRSLRRLAEGVLDGKGSDVWGANLLQSADEFLRANLAADAAVPSNWYERAAEQIIECQPLVQFMADHANYVMAAPTKIAVARAYAKDGVEETAKNLDPQLNLQVGGSSEPGSLEVTTVVLNFGLFQLQEMRMIEEGFDQWKRSQPESSENRYAWRGPEQFWKRLQQTGIFPLGQDKQAMARLLAFSPIPPAVPVALPTTETYSVNGRNLEVNSESTRYEKYQRLNGELLSTGLSETLLQQWMDADPVTAKSHAQSIAAKLESRIAEAAAREGMESDWPDFVDMLREEAAALQDSVRKLPV
jgi:hypothetical protein